MRNIFDQYSQPENRLTHSLVIALAEDKRLLRGFVRWATGKSAPRRADLEIVEQGFPGESSRGEKDADKRGVPDACIYQDESWVLLIESKVAAKLTVDQLRRHQRSAVRRGFELIDVLAIGIVRPARPLPNSWRFKTWTEVYGWLMQESAKSAWAWRAAEYFVAAENRMLEEDYPMSGALTTFSGIPFGSQTPYNYPEAKRLLKLTMDELRQKRQLIRVLGMNPAARGRPAITGRDGNLVWDFLQIKGLARGEVFTRFPHLTIGIHTDKLLVIVTVPNGIRPKFRRNLIDLEFDGFLDLFFELNSRLLKALRSANGAAPWVIVVQRRYSTQRSQAIIDAAIEFDLRTAFPQRGKKGKVKVQPEWLQAVYEALSHKRSNLQVAVGASFPYKLCSSTTSPQIVDTIADVWIACKPLIDKMIKG